MSRERADDVSLAKRLGTLAVAVAVAVGGGGVALALFADGSPVYAFVVGATAVGALAGIYPKED